MAHFFFNFTLELCYPQACPPRAAGDPHLYMYTCELHLLGPKLTVMVPVPANPDGNTPMYAHGTRAQVMGAADVDGHTIVLRQPTVVPSEHPSRSRPFALFRATITAWTWDVFSATVAAGDPWPSALNVACLYDLQNEHLRGLDYVDEGTAVFISAHLMGFADNGLDFEVHDISLDPDVPPCNAGSFTLPSVHTPGAQHALCQWFATYYPYAKPADPVGLDVPTVTHSPEPEEAGAASVNAHAQAARCTSEDAASIRLALEKAFASRDEGPIGQTPVDPRYRNDTPSEPESELEWLRGTAGRERADAAPAYADASPAYAEASPAHANASVNQTPSAPMPPSSAIARARAAYLGTPSDAGSGPDADWSFYRRARDAPTGAPAYADSSAYGTPVQPLNEAPTVTVAAARSAIRDRIVSSKHGVPPVALPREVIDLTHDSTDEDDIFELPVGGVKRCKWVAQSSGTGRVVSCYW